MHTALRQFRRCLLRHAQGRPGVWRPDVVFGRHPPRSERAEASGHDQRSTRPFQHVADGFERKPFGLAALRELREIAVVESGVITPSANAAPDRTLSMSSSDPRWTAIPASVKEGADASERAGKARREEKLGDAQIEWQIATNLTSSIWLIRAAVAGLVSGRRTRRIAGIEGRQIAYPGCTRGRPIRKRKVIHADRGLRFRPATNVASAASDRSSPGAAPNTAAASAKCRSVVERTHSRLHGFSRLCIRFECRSDI